MRRWCVFPFSVVLVFPGGRKRHHHSPRVRRRRRRRRRAGGDTDTEYECSSCGVLVSWYDEKQEARGGVCVRACVRLRGYFKCGGRFLSKKKSPFGFFNDKKATPFFLRRRARRRFRRRSARVRFSRVVFDAASFGLPRVLDDIPRANAMPRRSIGRYFESPK